MGINEIPQAYLKKMKAMIPSGKFCNPEEIFSSVKFFIENTYANGDVINLKGGMI